MPELHAALSRYFGHGEFRPHQEEIIRRVMAGESVLGVLPTGAGKSLCYQLPALLLPRPTLILSPLIALMQDQLAGLPPQVYPRATLINSSLPQDEVQRRLAAVAAGSYQLVYAAPERLRQQGFLRVLREVGLSLVVVDEAHCVSVWGHDFRPDYLFIRRALDRLEEGGERPALLAVTATATPEMQAEIATQLGRPLQTVTAPVFRPNLVLEVARCANADDKMRRLAEICKETTGPAIVYANSRERCEKLALFLRRQNLRAAHYHAGMDRDERQRVQDGFMLERTRIIVATVAFGMGIDKPNVRLVVHFSPPESLEAYTQEAGRAGRDGRPSRCVMLIAPADKANLTRWLRREEISLATVRDVYRALRARLDRNPAPVNADELAEEVLGPPDEEASARDRGTTIRVAVSLLERSGMLERHPDAGRDMVVQLLPPPPTARADLEAILELRRRHADRRLAEVIAYAEEPGCRHARISRHFRQPLEPCETACDFCLGTADQAAPSRSTAPTSEEIPDVGRVILQTVLTLPFAVGRTGLVKVLAGSVDSTIKEDRCALFGILRGFSQAALERAVDQLVGAGLLDRNPDDEYRRLFVTPEGQAALETEGEILANPNRPAPPKAPRWRPDRVAEPRPRFEVPDSPLDGDEEDRFERLRAWRRITAQAAGLPPYTIFKDATLRAIARANPTTLEELLTLPGVGPKTLEQHGEAVLEVLHPTGGEEIGD